MSEPVREYDHHVSVDDSGFDSSLEIKVWDGRVAEVAKFIRIPVEDIPVFMADVVSHGTKALSRAAERLEVGHCETCGNTRLVDEPAAGGRMSNKRCPDCKPRLPSEPFKNAPHIGRKEQ